MKLPAGWTWAFLESLLSTEPRAITDGPFGSNLKSSHYTDKGARVLRLQNVGDGIFRDERAHISLEHFETLRNHEAKEGDLILASLGEVLPRVALIPKLDSPSIVKADVIRARIHEFILAKWVMYALLSSHIRRYTTSRIKGVGRPRLGLGEIRKLPIPVPPVAEQRRIVETLDDHLSRCDVTGSNLATAQRRTTILLQRLAAVAVTSGIHSANETTLGSVAKMVKNGIFVSRPGINPIGTPILRIGAVRPLRLDTSNVRYTGFPKDSPELAGTLLNPGDLLFTRYNGNPEYVGACAIVPEKIGPLTYPDKLIRVVVDNQVILPEYAALACTTGVARDYIRNHTKTTAGQAGISGRELKMVPLALPSLEEQQRRVQQYNTAAASVELMQREIERAQVRSSHLRQALLNHAFTGQLVPQDLADEPASVLLDRIRAEREAKGGHAKRATRSPRRTAASPDAQPSLSAPTKAVQQELPL
ncbi:restriction endonuclease subunit S [Actinokineospora globicatena]|uniref:restriction endonuclease subunit S n=1 Tax=Actinokineospora globicatena TaxID=103729 RepID=UPI002553AB46|nr:restriction endonuclease subunit S [Actinokineospora globicatena]